MPDARSPVAQQVPAAGSAPDRRLRKLVVTTCYNEIENLPSLVDEIFRTTPDVEVLVVDDNSPDGTGTWCAEKSRSEPRLHLLARTGKLGQGSAVIAGLRYAIAHDYDLVLTMDADFSHHPCYVPDLFDGLAADGGTGTDVMIGSRYISRGGVEGWPLRRRLMSRAINLYTRALLGVRVKDCSGGFRAYRVPKLAELDLDALRSRGYSFHEEMLWLLKRAGCRFGETPITFVDRVRGKSKINMREAWIAVRIIFSLAMRDLFRR